MSKKQLTREEILHLAKLSKLQVTDAEIGKYQKQIDETLDYVQNLSELDTSKVKETNHTVDLINVEFEDGEKNDRGLTSKKGYFIVKRILS